MVLMFRELCRVTHILKDKGMCDQNAKNALYTYCTSANNPMFRSPKYLFVTVYKL